MQNRSQKQQSSCPACGMMSFPSKGGVFTQPKEEPKKVAPASSSEKKSEISPVDVTLPSPSNARRRG